jgi:hypothetical protein
MHSIRFECEVHADTCRILPVLALLFLCSFIDRTNVGNAKILGLEADLHINDHQYAIGLCVFYATYIVRYVRAARGCVWQQLMGQQ